MMHKTLTITLVTGLLLAGIAVVNAGKGTPKPGSPKKLLRHLELFQFKKDTTEQKVNEITKTFAALPNRIDAIEDFEWGTDVSVENKAAGFTHGFLVTFRDENGRKKYLPHPEHREFVKLVGPHVEQVLVFDYWAK